MSNHDHLPAAKFQRITAVFQFRQVLLLAIHVSSVIFVRVWRAACIHPPSKWLENVKPLCSATSRKEISRVLLLSFLERNCNV